jgi:hypothetical protein
MSVFVITGVKLDDGGRVAEAVCGRADTANNQYIGQPTTMLASDIASRIYGGDQAFSVISVDGHRVLGPQFRYVTYDHGREGIVLEEDARFTIHDLVLIGDQDNAS